MFPAPFQWALQVKNNFSGTFHKEMTQFSRPVFVLSKLGSKLFVICCGLSGVTVLEKNPVIRTGKHSHNK